MINEIKQIIKRIPMILKQNPPIPPPEGTIRWRFANLPSVRRGTSFHVGFLGIATPFCKLDIIYLDFRDERLANQGFNPKRKVGFI
jgi:hypothetical protein